MHIKGQMIRILGAAALAGALITTMTSAFAAPSGSASTTTPFTVRTSIAGGIKTIQNGQTLTFVFTEINQSARGAYEDLDLTRVANVSVADMTCVLPGGFAIFPDTPDCEPGLVKPGRHASMVVTTTVTGASGATASARVCLFNESTGVTAPCRTKSVKIA